MTLKLQKAMILAAGLGKRMRPLTLTLPKPLIPVAGKPLIDWSIDWLVQAGIKEVIVNTSYLAEPLEDYLSLRKFPPIHFSREEPAPLETGGGIRHALPLMGTSPFLIMNSDNIYINGATHPVHKLAEQWSDDLDFLMLLFPKAAAIGWSGNGDFIRDDAGRIRRPSQGEDAPYIFTGVEVIHPRIFTNCPEGAFSLNWFWQKLTAADGWIGRVGTLVYDGTWLNVGDLEGLKQSELALKKML
ncbi:MAG: nucleotidyltransferase family protein [Alphaproteobacteria bacterium]